MKQTKPDIKNNINTVKLEPMSSKLIREYLPNVKIVQYDELKDYNNIEELLPNDKSYFILLYIDKKTPYEVSGHWCAVTRTGDTIFYFDPYGKPVDYPIDHWFKHYKTPKYLSNLFDKSSLEVFSNSIGYQSKDNYDISTCGRHCIFFILSMLKGKDSTQYYKLMRDLKKKTHLSYDKLVSYFINLI
jgi:hypothetical protein